MSRRAGSVVYTGVNGAWTTRGRKAGAVLLLAVASAAGTATSPARRAFCSVRAFASYYQVLGAAIHPNTWDRLKLSAMLAVADSTGAQDAGCPRANGPAARGVGQAKRPVPRGGA